jgi:uncharacterized protein (DUF2235 family)
VPKNLIIFSDGTGQHGGLLFDENRSNIYKLYRATRCGPDSTISPADQIAFYDPGLGANPSGRGSWWKSVYNFVSQATGLGLTSNIIDCYAEIIRSWRPGDRIFLFGFSRGAYTVRCLASVLAFCGVPTTSADGTQLLRSPSSARRIAKEAVTTVYQHVGSVREDPIFLDQRRVLAEKFRSRYRSAVNGKANAVPYFIGVFDTVASLAHPGFLVAAGAIVIALLAIICLGMWLLVGSQFEFWFGLLLAISSALAIFTLIMANIKFAFGLPGHPFWRTVHFTNLRFEHYDQTLSLDVLYVRHAIAIDERRASFDRVKWGVMNEWPVRAKSEPA